jgi:hypothetical protein
VHTINPEVLLFNNPRRNQLADGQLKTKFKIGYKFQIYFLMQYNFPATDKGNRATIPLNKGVYRLYKPQKSQWPTSML